MAEGQLGPFREGSMRMVEEGGCLPIVPEQRGQKAVANPL